MTPPIQAVRDFAGTVFVDPVEIARALVQIPSVNPNYDPESQGEVEATAWVAGWARKAGFDVEIQPVADGRENVVLRFVNLREHPHLLLNGHLDTVGIQGMKIDPFAAEIREGRLWGRGACDMKGPLGSMLSAAVELLRAPGTWQGKLTVACVVDEEHRFRGIREFLRRESDLPDKAIVGEPTGLRVVRGCKGCMRFDVETKGRAAHSSRPWEGQSAIVAMAKVIQEIERFFLEELSKRSRPDFGASTGSIGLIQGGEGVNVVPASCRIQVDVRLVPGQSWKETHEDLQSYLRAKLPPAGNVAVYFPEPFLVDELFELAAGHPFVTQACETLQKSPAEVVFYSCDASKIAARGVPSIILGPGNIQQAHSAEESISLESLNLAKQHYVALARALMPPSQATTS